MIHHWVSEEYHNPYSLISSDLPCSGLNVLLCKLLAEIVPCIHFAHPDQSKPNQIFASDSSQPWHKMITEDVFISLSAIKLIHVDIYTRRLKERERRKKISREFGLITAALTSTANKAKEQKDQKGTQGEFSNHGVLWMPYFDWPLGLESRSVGMIFFLL